MIFSKIASRATFLEIFTSTTFEAGILIIKVLIGSFSLHVSSGVELVLIVLEFLLIAFGRSAWEFLLSSHVSLKHIRVRTTDLEIPNFTKKINTLVKDGILLAIHIGHRLISHLILHRRLETSVHRLLKLIIRLVERFCECVHPHSHLHSRLHEPGLLLSTILHGELIVGLAELCRLLLLLATRIIEGIFRL